MSKLTHCLVAVIVTASLVAAPAASAQAASRAPAYTVAQLLTGKWLGPFPGPNLACGENYAEWFFYRTGSYTYTWNTSECGGSTSYGRYGWRGDVLILRQQGVPGCATCTQRQVIRVYYRFITVSALRFCDYPARPCYMYYRQG